MKTIIMSQSFPLLFKTEQELHSFIKSEGYRVKESKLGIKYIVKDETISN
jgi:hypothetical protein